MATSSSDPLNDYDLQFLEPPFAFILASQLDHNAHWVREQASAAGKTIRLVTKSLRSIGMIKYLQKMGHPFQGLMAFSVAEANLLFSQGLDSILVAYPSWETQAIEVALGWIQKGKDLIFMIDDLEQAQFLSQLSKKHHCQIPVCIDIDLSLTLPGLNFGVYRSPLRSMAEIKKFFSLLSGVSGLSPCALMGYEAQLAGIGDHSGMRPKDWVVKLLKAQSKDMILERRFQVKQEWKKYSWPLRFFNGGGTGSLSWSLQDPSLDEVAIGSAFYCPHLFDQFDGHSLRPAAGFALRVTRHPHSNIFTCFSGGYVASGEAGMSRLPIPWSSQEFEFEKFEGAGEVQTPLRCQEVGAIKMGDMVAFRHAKAGELADHFSFLHLLKKSAPRESFSTYRMDLKTS